MKAALFARDSSVTVLKAVEGLASSILRAGIGYAGFLLTGTAFRMRTSY